MVKHKKFIVSIACSALLLSGCGSAEAPTSPPIVAYIQPIQEAVEQPTKPTFRIEEVIVTYYTASDDECGKSDKITASGAVASEGRTIAADHLPIGTIVEIEGIQYVVEDRFGGGYTNKIDVYTESKEYAFKKGRRKVEVKIYE